MRRSLADWANQTIRIVLGAGDVARDSLVEVAVDSDVEGDTHVRVSMSDTQAAGGDVDVEGTGNGPIAAFANALSHVDVEDSDIKMNPFNLVR